MIPNSREVDAFREVVYGRYRRCGRSFPWRETTDPYAIHVSEIMLQQTGTTRVASKYEEFLSEFPSYATLAASSTSEVLRVWSGLGYNRRAKYLRDSARIVIDRWNGVLPKDPETLTDLPGIGKNTAGAIVAFAYNTPVVFIETNIRRVFLHAFFAGRDKVHDTELLPFIEATLDPASPRVWYWALMDFGVFLAREFPNPNRRSAHHTRQAPFENSNRQIRGRVIRLLADGRSHERDEIVRALAFPEQRIHAVIDDLADEGLIAAENDALYIP